MTLPHYICRGNAGQIEAGESPMGERFESPASDKSPVAPGAGGA
jgi:hypothetical protein